MATASTKAQETTGPAEMTSSTSSRDDSPSSETPNLETAEAPGTSSSASSKEAYSSSVESPNLETAQSPETPSSRSKDESSASGSPYLEFSETPESSAAIDSTLGTSNDGDEIVVLSSKTESPTLMSTVFSSFSRVASEIESCCDPCIQCFNMCSALYNYLKCSKEAKCKFYNSILLSIGAFGIAIAFLIITLKVHGFWEMLNVSILIMFCSFLSACTVRGCFAKPPPPIFPKRKRAFSPSQVAEKSKKGTIPVTSQTDPPEDENNIVLDICEDPGAPESSSDGAVSG